MSCCLVWRSLCCSLFLSLVSPTLVAQSNPPGLNFAPAVTYSAGGFSGANGGGVAIADVNGDGRPDLVVASPCTSMFPLIGCFNSSVAVLLGNGDGTFQAAVMYDSGGFGASSVAVADINGDGKPDIIVTICVAGVSVCASGAGTQPGVGVLLGNGDGTFQTAVTYAAGPFSNGLFIQAFSVAVADVNGDGEPDLLVAVTCMAPCSSGTSAVSVLLGNGNGTFQAPVTYDSGGFPALSIAVADVNGDGKPDLVVWETDCFNTSSCPNNVGTGEVGVMLGKGDGTFLPAVTYGSGGLSSPGSFGPQGVTVADVNGDGKPDILAANTWQDASQANGGVGVLLGNGDGTFRTAASYNSGGNGAAGLAVADVNGDGKADLVVVNPCSNCAGSNGVLGVLLGNGDGTFQTAVAYGSGGIGPASVAVADLNGDGKPDLVVVNVGATVGVLINTSVAPTVTLSGSPQQPLTIDGSGNFVAQVTITNTGNVTVSSIQVTSATLGSGSMLSAPAAITNLAPGASGVVTLTFPPNSVLSGATTAPLKLNGTYSVTSPALGGNWALSFRRVTL